VGALYQHHVERAAAGGAPSAHGAGVASGGQVRGEASVTALDVLRRTPGEASACGYQGEQPPEVVHSLRCPTQPWNCSELREAGGGGALPPMLGRSRVVVWASRRHLRLAGVRPGDAGAASLAVALIFWLAVVLLCCERPLVCSPARLRSRRDLDCLWSSTHKGCE